MMESAVPLQIGYGYGFGNQMKTAMPPPTWQFAKSFYPYMRFGLAFTLMQGGFFTHEFGDSNHGQDWYYDELDYKLGLPASPPRRLPGPAVAQAAPVDMPEANWSLWVDPAASAALVWDKTDKRSETAAARVTVKAAGSTADRIDLHTDGKQLVAGLTYKVTFLAKSSVAPYPLGVNTRKDQPGWDAYGLDATVLLSTTWQQHSLEFVALANTTDCRLSFWLGKATGTVWVDNVTMSRGPPIPPPVYAREFDHGLVILNGDTVPHTVPLGPGYRKLLGRQAPLHQYIVDDNSSAFSVRNGSWSASAYQSGYDFSQPTNEVARGPYFHAWAGWCHETGGEGVSQFDLGIAEAGRYNLSVWWAAATPANQTWSKTTVFEVRNPCALALRPPPSAPSLGPGQFPVAIGAWQ